jgi:5'-3' exonuclease
MAESSPDTVLVVDSLNLAFRYKHQGALFFKDDYVRTVESLKKSYKAGQVVILSDWGSSSYRKQIYPEYKQNRKDLQEKQTPEEQAYFEKFFEEYVRVVEHYQNNTNYPTFRFKGVEADDMAAYIVKNREALGYKQIWLVSSDKDWDLLISPGVSRFSYVTRKEVTWDNWSDHYDVTPEEYISMKCLMGDPGDNVPGIFKVGPTTAKKLIDQYGSALDVANNIPLAGKYVYIKNTNEFGGDAIIRNYQLMDLLTFCEDAIGSDNINIINNELT